MLLSWCFFLSFLSEGSKLLTFLSLSDKRVLLCFSSRADEEQIWIFKAFSLEVCTAFIDMLTFVVNFSVQVKKMWKSPSWRQKQEETCVCPVCVSRPHTPVQLLHHPEEDVCWSSSPGWRTLRGDLKGCPGLSQTQWTWCVCRRTSRPSFCPSHESGSWNLSSSVQLGLQLHKFRLLFWKRSYLTPVEPTAVPTWDHPCVARDIKPGNPPSDFRWPKWELIKLLLVTQLHPDVAAQQS